MSARRYACAAIAAGALAMGSLGCSSDKDEGSPAPRAAGPAPRWPAPRDALGQTVKAGLKPARKEFLKNHVHAHLDVFVDGKHVVVPAGIGINIRDPDVQTFDEPGGKSYGGIELCRKPCISPLHTHDATGTLHTESATSEQNTLGEFFTEWGMQLSKSCAGPSCGKPVAFYVNGTRYTGDPGAIQLTDRKEIAVVIGTPPKVIPKTANIAA